MVCMKGKGARLVYQTLYAEELLPVSSVCCKQYNQYAQETRSHLYTCQQEKRSQETRNQVLQVEQFLCRNWSILQTMSYTSNNVVDANTVGLIRTLELSSLIWKFTEFSKHIHIKAWIVYENSLNFKQTSQIVSCSSFI